MIGELNANDQMLNNTKPTEVSAVESHRSHSSGKRTRFKYDTGVRTSFGPNGAACSVVAIRAAMPSLSRCFSKLYMDLRTRHTR